MRVFCGSNRPISNLTRSVGLGLAICFGATAIPPPAFAQMSSYEQQKVIQFLRTPRTEMKSEIFDGANFIAGTDKTRAYNYMVDFINAMNKANRIVGTMTSHARGTTEGQAFLKETKQKLDYARAMQAAYPAFEQAEAQPAAPASEETQTPAATASEETKTPAATAGTIAVPTREVVMNERERQSVQEHLDRMDEMEANGIFQDGAFDVAASLNDANKFYKKYSYSIRDATTAINRLTGEVRQTDEAQAMVMELEKRGAKSEAIYAALKNHQQVLIAAEKAKKELLRQQAADAKIKAEEDRIAAEAAAKAAEKQRLIDEAAAAERQARERAEKAEANKLVAAKLKAERAAAAPACEALTSVIDKRSTKRRLDYLKNLSLGTQSERLLSILDKADEINTECAKPLYSNLNGNVCDAMEICSAASKAKRRIRSLVTTRRVRDSRDLEPLEMNQWGFMKIFGPTDFEAATTFAGRAFFGTLNRGTDSAERNAGLMERLGITFEDFNGYERKVEELAEFREEILDEAGSWPPANSAPDTEEHPGAKIAIKHVERTHPDAEVLWVGLKSDTWDREWYGDGYRYWVVGHILFKLPDDPLCQMRYFRVIQKGGITAKSIDKSAYNLVRFQDCDRR